MLKALEIVGFKSFADKTRFEFPPGITVVVGPNGSGKSNIVDAIKWVLGEQSVKSLRGREMADVIFNGSGGRRATNSAEITVTFDNSNHLLSVDSPEVHITRRVYRSGEGEYLINRQPSRLKDIRAILSGTGMGTHAYSVIEQGKVDILLQSSPRERRIIFEEAAGISLFKAKKIEALRRLERVEQNLLRLCDIVDEVENRLRSVRAQANKANRYKEYTDRLQELRTQVAMVDWRRLTERIQGFENELTALTSERDTGAAEAESVEAQLLEAESQIETLTEAIRSSEAKIAANRERIAARESTLEHERRRSRDCDAEVARHRRQLAAMNARAGNLHEQLLETGKAVEEAEDHHGRIGRELVEEERALTELIGQLDHLRGENEQRRTAHRKQMHEAASLGNEISAQQSRAASARDTREATQKRLEELDRQVEALETERDTLRREDESLARRVDEEEERLSQARTRLETSRNQGEDAKERLADIRQQAHGAAQRIAVLKDLEQRQEGLSAGVKAVLNQARGAPGGPFAQVRGLVADLLNVRVDVAPLVDVALGAGAQYVVTKRSTALTEYLQHEVGNLPGRVTLLWLDESPPALSTEPVDLEGRGGVLGRADRFVETAEDYRPLATRLLGLTWFVEKLENALALRERAGAGLRFVTLGGELLEADGTLTVGPAHASTGLISRRSELRALEAQLVELETKRERAQSELEQCKQRIAEEASRLEKVETEHRKALEALQQHRHRITAAEERRRQLDEHRGVRQAELEEAVAEHEQLSHALEEGLARQQAAEAALAEAETGLANLEQRIEALEAQRQIHDRRTTRIKVELAKSEERLRNLHARKRQFEDAEQERKRTIDEDREQLAECNRRARQSQWAILQAESEIAELYLHKERLVVETASLVGRRDELGRRRSAWTAEAGRIRNRIRKVEEKIHAKQLEVGEIRHERNSLAGRLREDYGIELAESETSATDEEQHQREEVQQEIDDLRRKINNLGNVNLEALAELEELDARYQHLSGQYKDLHDAKTSLERIIDRINSDSRRLFSETFETVRGHFQALFRDLFGGGHADVILDEEGDILESGIEIVARPPGKEPRSISLLSGGEKTLTCVALLLAIFRSRPSPFCVLDEVDAALDEANIDRFTKVLQDFLTWTQFIIVTHSKKTMTCANTIYGVTMQESGVSKQVSVRFEDVSENGEILTSTDSDEDEETQAA